MSKESKVGLFVTISIMFLFLLSTQVSTFTLFDEKGYKVNILIDNIDGLEKSSKVKSNGITVGKVEDFAIYNKRVKVNLTINDGVKIPIDSTVQLRQESMLGVKYLDITLGDSSIFLEREGLLDNALYVASFDDTSNSMNLAAQDVAKFINRLDLLIANNETNINTILDNFKVLSFKLNSAIESFESTSSEFNTTALTINSDLPKIMQNINSLTSNLDTSSQDLKSRLPLILKEIEKLTLNLNEISDDAKGKLPTIFDKFEKLEDSTISLIDDNSKNIGSTIVNAKEFFGKGEESFAKLDDYLTTMTQGEMEVYLYNNYMIRDAYNKFFFGIDYKASPTKHYLVDVISTDDYGLNDNGNVNNPKKHEDSEILFSAQFAKDYNDLRFRIGAIESTGGLGVDYFLRDKEVVFSVDVFDFNAVNDARGDNPHLRLSSRFNMLKHLNFYLGADNILNEDSSNIFFGMGVNFIDDDLKYLLGSVQ
jgi:phospholipid/cholesterol/gamma-HCH transport system substrate-binding protein